MDIVDNSMLSTYLQVHYIYAGPSWSLDILYLWTLSKHFGDGGLVGVRIYAWEAYRHIKIQKMAVSWTSLMILGSQLIFGFTIFMPAPLDRFINSICGRCLSILETRALLGSGFTHERHMDTSKYKNGCFLDILDGSRLSTYLRAHYLYAGPSRSLHILYLWKLCKHFGDEGLVGVRIYAREAYWHIKILKWLFFGHPWRF